MTARLRDAGIARAAGYSWTRTAKDTIEVFRRCSRQAGRRDDDGCAAAADVAVIVVNFNTSAEARRCSRDRGGADLDGRSWTAIIVDNASSDGGAAALRGLPRTTG